MFTLFFVVVRKRYCLPTRCQNVHVIYINPYLFTKFHTSKHLGRRVGQTCMFTLFFCCGAKTVLFTNKLSECWCRISNPYLFTKFHASQHFGKSYTKMHIHIVVCCGVKSVLFTIYISYSKSCHSNTAIDHAPTMGGAAHIHIIRTNIYMHQSHHWNGSTYHSCHSYHSTTYHPDQDPTPRS